MQEKNVGLLIIGSGPAACTAAIYASRANLNPTIIIGNNLGGQLATTSNIENYPGFLESIKGPWLMDQMLLQAQKFGTNVSYEQVLNVDFSNSPFIVKTTSEIYFCKSIIIATGSDVKWLGLLSEEKYKGFGVSSCATCDGFLFKNKKILVIGGGNTAVEEAMHLSNYSNNVTLIHRKSILKAEKIMQKRLFNNKNITTLFNYELQEVLGIDNPKTVTGVKIKNTITNEIKELSIDGIFIAIGHRPNTEIFKPWLSIDNEGYIKTNSTKTNIAGIFAAGDVQDKLYKQAITAAATGCIAALKAEKFLNFKN